MPGAKMSRMHHRRTVRQGPTVGRLAGEEEDDVSVMRAYDDAEKWVVASVQMPLGIVKVQVREPPIYTHIYTHTHTHTL